MRGLHQITSFLSRWDQRGGMAETYPGRALAARVGEVVFPSTCPVTGTLVSSPGTLSPAGWASLDHLTAPWCRQCGFPFTLVGDGPLCLPCTGEGGLAPRLVGKDRLDAFRAPLAYDEVSADLILAIKYADRSDSLRVAGRLLARVAQALPAFDEAILIPVPLHHRRLRQRGYNQAGRLADALAAVTGRPVRHRLLRRIKATPSQKAASADQRRRHVSGAFAVRENDDIIRGRSFVLVDDVLTTGATLLSCARPLRQAGALSVSAVTLARVLPGRQGLGDPGGAV
ncbi:competence protein F [Parvularcula bermudensis HTCC2503]|uniref:Competence protein F n=1 Tax=Parvularcula bermudensis (strain ATCC BAA-594 / HTCC2503 / KCTC 12087) TaxID=314260 RepID=E0TG47_PARBH|nr:ComF family protein [Parvularcula bermudensis]ADM10618.1 competence protein F [Parvularcula bermudensis HTCC2503]